MTHSDIAGGSVFSVSPKSFQRYYGSIDVGYGADGPVISSSCRHLSHLRTSIFCYFDGNISLVIFSVIMIKSSSLCHHFPGRKMADSTHKFLSVSFFSFLISKLYFKFDGIAKIIAENEF